MSSIPANRGGQGSLFDKWTEQASIQPCDPHVEAEDVKRLSGQSADILARLEEGPATNAELAAISLKYTSRISDLRAAGYEIEARRVSGGTFEYLLTEN